MDRSWPVRQRAGTEDARAAAPVADGTFPQSAQSVASPSRRTPPLPWPRRRNTAHRRYAPCAMARPHGSCGPAWDCAPRHRRRPRRGDRPERTGRTRRPACAPSARSPSRRCPHPAPSRRAAAAAATSADMNAASNISRPVLLGGGLRYNSSASSVSSTASTGWPAAAIGPSRRSGAHGSSAVTTRSITTTRAPCRTPAPAPRCPRGGTTVTLPMPPRFCSARHSVAAKQLQVGDRHERRALPAAPPRRGSGSRRSPAPAAARRSPTHRRSARCCVPARARASARATRPPPRRAA